MAHEYFHVLQFHLGGQHPSADGSPAWLTEGTAVYGSSLYYRGRWGDIDNRIRDTWARESLRADGPLQAFEDWQVFYPLAWDIRPGRLGHGLACPPGGGAVRQRSIHATGTRRSGNAGRARRARVLPAAAIVVRLAGGVQEAFGIGVNDFYAAFEEYRAALVASRWPHLADDEDTPVLVFMGEIPADTVVRIRAEFKDLMEFSRERFGSGGEYTVFVAADPESAMAAHQSLLGWKVREGACRSWGVNVLFVFLTCGSQARDGLILYHFLEAPNRLTPIGSLSRVAEGYSAEGRLG